MPPDRVPAILHITAAAGGGAERYVRDLAATTPHRHYLLHVGPVVDVLEDTGAQRFSPLAGLATERGAGALARWREAAGIAMAHVHGIDATCRARLAGLRRHAPLPYLVTLHDLAFVNPRAFEAAGMPLPDPEWVGAIAPMLTAAATVIVPSAFMRDVAQQTIPGLRTTEIAPGLRLSATRPIPPLPAEFAAARPRRLVAVVGAVGPHKGSELLSALAAAFTGTDIGIAVIGYTDTRLVGGWAIPGRLYVHGPYQEDALAGWLAAYGPDVVLFPNRLPESFSYTLSEVWAAGYPVIVPDVGALGARVARHGGGWRLPPGFSAADAAALITRLCLDRGAAELARVKSDLSASDPSHIPLLSTMTREIDALYARYALAPQSAPDAAAAEHALAPLLAANLDGFVFRRELLNLAGQLQQAEADRDAARERCDRIERDAAAWAAKLEADIATLRRELTTERARLESDVARLLAARQGNEAQVRALADERTRWVDAQRRQDERIGALDGECARLATENGRLAAALAQQVEDSRRLAAEGARTAEANAGLAADLAQAAEVNAGLAVDLAQAAERHGVLAATLAATERRENEARATIAHLTQESAELRAATTAEIARLGAEIERLGAEIRQLTPHREALALLPEFLRNYLHRKALRARG